jgi:hypothetical protein
MTDEELHEKAAIAEQLALRDKRIEQLEALLAEHDSAAEAFKKRLQDAKDYHKQNWWAEGREAELYDYWRGQNLPAAVWDMLHDVIEKPHHLGSTLRILLSRSEKT